MSSTKKTTTRAKAKPTAAVPQSRQEVSATIAQIGQHITARMRLEAAMTDAIAAVRADYEAAAEPHNSAIKTLSAGVEAWCAAHRYELTEGGRRKTHAFPTGEVRWRMTPPAVTVRNPEGVLAKLREMGAHRFIRVKEEVNKDAILAEPGAVDGVIQGVTISQREEFEVVPHMAELADIPHGASAPLPMRGVVA